MITFVTLFLGLVTGPQPVELLVNEGVAAVELRLDGTAVGRLEAPPWTLDVDFGALLPHELVAVAFDAGGREVGEARLFVNLPRPAADVALAFDEEGGVVQLVWESTLGRDPISVNAFLDGVAVPVDDPRRIVLPPHEADQLHFLRVEVAFTNEVQAVEELTFGGGYGGETAGEMTAVLVRSEQKLKGPETLAGALTVDGKPLAVVAVEHGPAEVVVVPDRGFFGKDLEAVLWKTTAVQDTRVERYRPGGFAGRTGSLDTVNTQPNTTAPPPTDAPKNFEGQRLAVRNAWALGEGDHYRVIWPVPVERPSSAGGYYVFAPSPAFDARETGWLWIVSGLDPERMFAGEQRLTDAVAAAAMNAARNRRRRAVLLQMSSKPTRGGLEPDAVRRYASALQVPIYVLWPGKKSRQPKDWDDVLQVSTEEGIAEAVVALQRDLETQWVVWVEGLHLPHRIQVAAGRDVELVR